MLPRSKRTILINLLWCSLTIPLGFMGGYLTKTVFFSQIEPKLSLFKSHHETLTKALENAEQAANLAQNAVSSADWQQVKQDWQEAIALLETIPDTDSNYNLAQEKLSIYRINWNYANNNVLNPPYFQRGVNQAIAAANQAQTAKTKLEWDQVASLWQEAIILMEQITPNSPQYSLAQERVIIYQRNRQYALQNSHRVSEFRQGINQGMEAAILTQSAKSKQQWQQVAQTWQQAIAFLKSVTNSDPNYNLAQTKIQEYQTNLNYALNNIANAPSQMSLVTTIYGKISPKSVVYSGKDLFFAQNMMYNHNITVYDRQYQLIKTISDQVKLQDYGYQEFPHSYQGSPVEAAFSHGGKYAWVSNYQMYGKGFSRPGSDQCSPAANHDFSFLYRINTETLEIENVIKVGAVPKFLAVSPDDRLVLVSNWCSWDLTVIDIEKNQPIKNIKLGRYPRGVVIDSNSQNAYVAIMGSNNIAKINLKDFSVNWLNNIGSSPRHLLIDSQDRYLYSSLNAEGKIAKINLQTGKVMQKVATGSAPRSMTISSDNRFIYVVNYSSHTVSKISTENMKVVQTIPVNNNPIGITYDPETKQVWVACYSGSIVVLQD
jgi:YVTN family beta-propeller protein